MSNRRVPDVITDFNTWIRNTHDRLLAINAVTTNPYWQDFTFTLAQKDEWVARRNTWVNTLYPAYSNPATSTSIIKNDVREFMESFNTFAQPLLDKIEASGIATNTDEAIFNFVLGHKEPSTPTTPIADDCIAAVIVKGGGTFEVSCKSTTDQTRASEAPGSDGVQYAYMIVDKLEGTPPSFDNAGMQKEFSSKSKFPLSFGGEKIGKWLVIYFRWYNSKHPTLAGRWSGAHTAVIS